MKSLTIHIILLCMTSYSYCQTKYNYEQGYKFIKKAERNVKYNNYKKASRMITKAKNSNYGFCGNAWAEAFDKIDHVEIAIYEQTNEFDKALIKLDSINACSFGADCQKRDSLKIVMLIKKYGKQKVKDAFDQITEIKTTNEDFEKKTFIFLSEFNYHFYFKNEVSNSIDENSQISVQEILKSQPFYKLLE